MVHRVQHSTAGAGNIFVEKDSGLGVAATQVPALWCNMLQEELENVLLAAGITPTTQSNAQLVSAIGTLAGGGVYRNKLVGGDFQCTNRGRSWTGVTTALKTTVPHTSWAGSGGTPSADITVQNFALGQSDVPGNPLAFYRHVQTAVATTFAPAFIFGMPYVTDFAGQTATLSVWARVASGTLDVTPEINQVFGSGGSSSVLTVAASPWALDTTWRRFTWTVAVPSIAGKTIGAASRNYLQNYLRTEIGKTFTLELADLQWELGAVVTAFERRPTEVEKELGLSFFQASYDYAKKPGAVTSAGQGRFVGQSGDEWQFITRYLRQMLDYESLFGYVHGINVTWYSPTSGLVDRVDWNGDKVVSGGGGTKGQTGFPVVTSPPGTNQLCVFHWTAEYQAW